LGLFGIVGYVILGAASSGVVTMTAGAGLRSWEASELLPGLGPVTVCARPAASGRELACDVGTCQEASGLMRPQGSVHSATGEQRLV
jgi:hypothetical protein